MKTEEPGTHIGRVVSFDDKNGFGFIRAREIPEDVFVYASAVLGNQLLTVGQRVRFQADRSDRGTRAVRVEPIRPWPFGDPADQRTLGLVLLALIVGATATRLGIGWHWPVSWLVASNIITCIIFLWDKRRAILGYRPVPELILIALAVLGGTPSALAASALLGHKTHHGRFSMVLSSLLVAQLAVLGGAWWYWSR